MDSKSHIITNIDVTTRDGVVKVRVMGKNPDMVTPHPSLITIHRFSVGNEAMGDADKVTAMIRHAMTMHSYQVMAQNSAAGEVV